MSVIGGYWERTLYGWKANGGSTFPRPGGDWNGTLSVPLRHVLRVTLDDVDYEFKQSALDLNGRVVLYTVHDLLLIHTIRRNAWSLYIAGLFESHGDSPNQVLSALFRKCEDIQRVVAVCADLKRVAFYKAMHKDLRDV